MHSEEGEVSRDMEVVLLSGSDRFPVEGGVTLVGLSGGSDTPRRRGDVKLSDTLTSLVSLTSSSELLSESESPMLDMSSREAWVGLVFLLLPSYKITTFNI